MKKTINSKHIGSMVVYTLLSLFLCMAGVDNASAAEQLNPVVKIDNTSYTSSGTEVTLRLWMFNDSNPTTNYSARFTGDVNLYVDDQVLIKLNSIWSSIAGATRANIFTAFTDNHVDINLDGTNVGTAQFNNLQYGQTCPDNSNKTEKVWYTVDLKLSFNKSFSYYGHKITVKGKWQDKSSGSLVEKDVALDNDINGFVRPVNLKAQPSGDNMVFSWEQQGYNSSASTDGKWVVYKCEGDNNVKLGEVAANEQSLSIAKKQYSCSKDYIMTFLPDACKGAETVCGLNTSIGGKTHLINADDICQMCGHSFFRYQTSDGNKVDISGKDFGAKVVSHKVIDSECVIEFDAPITQIPKSAFKDSKITGELRIPNTVTSIGRWAFYYCSELTGTLNLPNSVTTIEEQAFRNCSGLTDLKLPNNLNKIGIYAFKDCKNLTGELIIPNSVKEIGDWAFHSCVNLNKESSQVTLPKSLKKIGQNMFQDCEHIKTFIFQSLPEGIIKTSVNKNVSLSDDSYIINEFGYIWDKFQKISYTRTMTNEWGTLVLPFYFTLTGDELYSLYTIEKVSGDELVLRRIEGKVDAGTPCVVKRNSNETELSFKADNPNDKVPLTINAQTVGDMTFRGTYWTEEVNSGYVISKGSFWNVEELKKSELGNAVKVHPFRAWLDGTSANAPAQLSMRIDGSATGIDAVDALNDAEAEYYDLSGNRLDAPQNGVNIVRMKSGKTKKIIIK